ncbi:MAG: hypothetical protein KDM91_06620 [Verrucomicrobiae bacterium]|nr:hypothetical protein [Verrucomicrobiae bacterium]MCP5551416.1 hypothetical protein [Akkermansiaceae bacterium]
MRRRFQRLALPFFAAFFLGGCASAGGGGDDLSRPGGISATESSGREQLWQIHERTLRDLAY